MSNIYFQRYYDRISADPEKKAEYLRRKAESKRRCKLRLLDDPDRLLRIKEREREKARERYAKDPKRKNESNKRWADKNPDYDKQCRMRLRERDRESWRLKKRLERSKYRSIQRTGTVSVEDWITICNQYGNVCLMCGKICDGNDLTADHIIPISKKGKHEYDNLQPLCRSCNSKKGIKIMDLRKASWI